LSSLKGLSHENVVALQPDKATTNSRPIKKPAPKLHALDDNEVTMADPVDSEDEVSRSGLYLTYVLR